ncbi:MAG: ATP-dependent helicase [Opitutales bacterium]|nr:ATP-dependent helicase [Opitutales bacterium]
MPYGTIDFERELNPEQFAAVSAEPGPALVLAGAGSGKTRTLTYRVAWLLHELREAPWKILLLTFTNKAAKEMTGRVEQLCPELERPQWSGTFHSIGARFLRTHGRVVGLENNFSIMDEGDSENLFKDAVNEVDKHYLKEKDMPKVKPLLGALSYTRNTCGSFHDTLMERYPWAEDEGYLPRFKDFASVYEQKKRESQLIDYDDLLGLWLQVLEKDDEVRTQWQRKFAHVLVDEYQDTNMLQSKIVDLLAANHQIMAVGDDAQCIYTWRGANFENIASFTDRHPQAQIYKIGINYRSTPQILNLANSILASDPGVVKFPKELTPFNPPGEKPYVVAVFEPRNQADFIIKRIQGLLDEGYSYSDIAVLYRSHYHAMELQLELSRHRLPFVITSGVKFFEQAHIRDIIAHIQFVINPMNTPAWQRLACLLPKVGAKTAERLLKLMHNEVSTQQAVEIDLFNAAPEHSESIPEAMTTQAVMSKVPADAREDWDSLATTLQDIQEACDDSRCGDAIQFAVEGWYEGYLKANFDNWESRAEDLNALIDFASRFSSMTEMLEQLALTAPESGDKVDEAESAYALRLTTIHQAKGLEFPIVFILGMADEYFPSKRAMEEGDLDEERRLFYVAATRAEKELYMLYPSKVLRPGKGVQPLNPSLFLQQLEAGTYQVLRFSNMQF